MAADLSRGALPFLRASRKLGHPHVSHAKESFRRGTHSLYSGHVPTTTLEKGFVAVFSAFKALGNPHRADMVAALGDTTSGPALRRMRDRMYEDAEGRAILSDRPIITNAGISEALAEHGIAIDDAPSSSSSSSSSGRGLLDDDLSFGEAYARFMGDHGFDPDSRDTVRFVDDEELAYVMLRYRQTHDFAHVVCGLPPTVLGEVALKWFELAQTGMPMCALSSIVGPLRLPQKERRLLRSTLAPWALMAGVRCKRPLHAVRFEDEFATPLGDLRRRLGVTPAPPVALTTTGGSSWTPSDEGAGPVV